jgi:predicted PurR-regulated permease PerM
MRRSDVGWREILQAHWLGAVLAAAITVACWPVAHVLRARDAHFLVTTAAVSATAAVVGIALVIVGLRLKQPDLVWLHGMFRDAIRKRRKPRSLDSLTADEHT